MIVNEHEAGKELRRQDGIEWWCQHCGASSIEVRAGKGCVNRPVPTVGSSRPFLNPVVYDHGHVAAHCERLSGYCRRHETDAGRPVPPDRRCWCYVLGGRDEKGNDLPLPCPPGVIVAPE